MSHGDSITLALINNFVFLFLVNNYQNSALQLLYFNKKSKITFYNFIRKKTFFLRSLPKNVDFFGRNNESFVPLPVYHKIREIHVSVKKKNLSKI